MKLFKYFIVIALGFLVGWCAYSMKDSVSILTEIAPKEDFKIVYKDSSTIEFDSIDVFVTPYQDSVLFGVTMNGGNCENISPTEKQKFAANNYPEDFPRDHAYWYRYYPVEPFPIQMKKGETVQVHFKKCTLVSFEVQTNEAEYTYNY